jgi:putative membrane protein
MTSRSRQEALPDVPISQVLEGTDHDESTELSRKRTSLSIERSFLAFERTLMSWLRTSLSMISFGFTLVKFFEFLEDERGGPIVGGLGRTWATTTLGMAMIVIGTGALVVAIIQHRRRVEALRREGLLPQWNLALNVAVLVAVLGVFAMGSIFLGR